jgi:hypothetical protein
MDGSTQESGRRSTVAKFAFLVPILLLVAGCGSPASNVHPNSSEVRLGRVHSPEQVGRVFAVHRLALAAPTWNLPGSKDGVISSILASSTINLKRPPPGAFDIHRLGLFITIWWSDPAAAHDASPKVRAANVAHFVSHLLLQYRAAFEPTADQIRYGRTMVVDNVVADYVDSPYTATAVARLKATMRALAQAPTVKPPCSGSSCADTSP